MMVEDGFEDDKGVLCVRFNGWLFQGFEDAKAVLIETIVDDLLRKRSTYAKVADRAKRVLQRVDGIKVGRGANAYGILLATGIPRPRDDKGSHRGGARAWWRRAARSRRRRILRGWLGARPTSCARC